MKRFTIMCDFGGQQAPFTVCIGISKEGMHPLHFQADWLSKMRGGIIPGDVMEAIAQLQDLSKKYNVLLEELCVYALGKAKEQSEEDDEESDEYEEDDEEFEDDESQGEMLRE